jgi:predicted nucleotidyltransferase
MQFSPEEIADFCARWKVREFAIFGSALTSDFRPDSDVDVLVTFQPEARPTLWTLGFMQDELEKLFGRKVDLLERGGVEQMTNPYYRQSILSTARVIHAG